MRDKLFVVAVASEKGGVGKTTLATNLAVYLKALREDLPVTIVSFDNHFSVDNMFAIGRTRGRSVAALFDPQTSLDAALQLGEFGVQFMASERRLDAAGLDPQLLRSRLAKAQLAGILIIDTRPILDVFTISAVLCADLVLVPVKDRASVVNSASLHQLLEEHGQPRARIWLVPSLVDGRLRLQGQVGMRDYLAFAAEERGFQVFPGFIPKSPKVEGLASGFSSKIPPIITHARGTAVHSQLRGLADFVLQRRDTTATTVSSDWHQRELLAAIPPGRRHRLMDECPVCSQAAAGDEGGLFLHLRSRRSGFIHAGCLEQLLSGSELQSLLPDEGLLLVDVVGSGLSGGPAEYRLALFDAQGAEVVSERVGRGPQRRLRAFVERACARREEELLRELLLIPLSTNPPAGFLAGEGARRFRELRRRALSELASVEL